MLGNFVFLYPYVTLTCLGLLAVAVLYRLYRYKPIAFIYPLTATLLKTHSYGQSLPHQAVFIIRLSALICLSLLAGGLRKIDPTSKLAVKGIDIMLVMDVSGSMQAFDDLNNPCIRIEAAKREAIAFVKGRSNDQIGLVLFGKHAVSRCPLTIDTAMLIQLIADLSLGVIDADGTVLAQGMLIGANRLKDSSAASKIMIVLTDGQPTQNDLPMHEVMPIIKQLGIRIYTIGIGNPDGTAYLEHPLVGVVGIQTPLNKTLLEEIAQQSGGAAFLASNPDELKKVYHAIDVLEKTERNAPIFTTYFDFFKVLTLSTLLLLSIEWALSTMVWISL